MILGTGIDMLRVERMERALDRWGDRILHRVFTREEAAYCERRKRKAQSYAGRFAAKEAVMKALGTGWRGGVRFRDIEVVRRGGPPTIELHGLVADLARERGVRRLHLSLTHEGGYSMAQVILEG
jgi:holo-[acyl-carrier protein] synthase